MSNTSVIRQVLELEKKSLRELKSIYKDLFLEEFPSTSTKPGLIRPKIAYRLQELAFGGLSETTKLKLESIAKSGMAVISKAKHSNLIPGTKICREHNGIMHEVEVVSDGFEYQGKKWTSLSAIATKITGTKWNGPKFFGMRG